MSEVIDFPRPKAATLSTSSRAFMAIFRSVSRRSPPVNLPISTSRAIIRHWVSRLLRRICRR